MLKETSQSLRLYFGIVAAFSLFSGVIAVLLGGGSPLVLALSAASIIFGALFGYIVVKFSEVLSKRSAFIKNVLLGNLALSALIFLLSLTVGVQPGAIFRLAIALLIYFYLVKTVTRLAAEASVQNA